ncbi:MAG: DUF2871 domain-containing protein [Canibacter sp.]
MRKLFFSSVIYVILGLSAGLFYREFTKAQGFPAGEYTQLAVAHTHLLTLGFIISAIVLAFEAVFQLSRSRAFNWFFWVYNIGVLVSTAMMLWRGSLTVLGTDIASGLNAAISGMAGLGHIALTLAFVFLFVALGKALHRNGWKTRPEITETAQA